MLVKLLGLVGRVSSGGDMFVDHRGTEAEAQPMVAAPRVKIPLILVVAQ